MSVKNSNDTIGNRNRDLPVCSEMPQVTRHRVPRMWFIKKKYFKIHFLPIKYSRLRLPSWIALPWRYRQYIRPKRYLLTSRHTETSPKTWIFSNTAVRTWNLIHYISFKNSNQSMLLTAAIASCPHDHRKGVKTLCVGNSKIGDMYVYIITTGP